MSGPDLGGAVADLPRMWLPRDWGFDMTVCIAAICRQENRLLAVTDLLLSGEFVSHDTQTLKLAPISQDGRWLMMYAGDPSVHLDIQNRATEILAGGPDEMRDVVAACERAFHELRRHRI